jgi:hypothetical protein
MASAGILGKAAVTVTVVLAVAVNHVIAPTGVTVYVVVEAGLTDSVPPVSGRV